ncbi:putative legumain protein [Helianthus annuus]|nr:putative legumain protein [Helianthus annuus]
MTNWLLLLVMMMLMVRNTCLSQPSSTVANGTRWDVLEAATNRIHLDDDHGIRENEYYAYYLWNLYNTSSRSQRFEIVNEMSEVLKKIAYRDSRHDMIGLILFGPEKSRSILTATIDYKRQDVGEDYSQCLETIADLYMKHCGPIDGDGLRHRKSWPNMCLYAEDKAMIEEAIIVTCGSNNVAPYGIDAGNPITNVIPAPFHGSSEYCGRVSINGISRMELRSYAKSYEVIFEPVVFDEMHNMTQVCFHRDASRGLCQCKKDDWKFIKRGLHEFYVSPYEQKFVDVKFTSGVFGFVTVEIKEDLRERWRYVLLSLGAGALFLSGSKYVLNQNTADGDDDRVLTWAVRVVAAVAILLSSDDTLLAIVALASSLALNFVIIPIIARVFKTNLLQWVKLRESSTRDTGSRDWLIKTLDRIVVLPHNSQDDHGSKS